jgi:hypothetical protein
MSSPVFTLQDFMLDKSYSNPPSSPSPLPSLPCTFLIRSSRSPESFLGSRGGLLQSILTAPPETPCPQKTKVAGSSSSDSGYDSKATAAAVNAGAALSPGTTSLHPKRSKGSVISSLSSHSSGKLGGDGPQRNRRFERTRSALQQSGLLDVTMNTADLMKCNRTLDSELVQLRKSTHDLLRSILNNPQNRPLREFLLLKKKERELLDK